jgi:hypothetical protein
MASRATLGSEADVTVETRMDTAPPAWERIRNLFAEDAVAGQALLGDDPVAGLNHRLPLLLVEPSDTLLVTDEATQRTYELQVELLTLRGFRRLTPDATVPGLLHGWAVRRVAGALELRDPYGDLWARVGVTPDSQWLDRARQGEVIVLYGTCLGVRPPDGVPAWQYGPHARAAELRTGRRHGLVAAATVAWVDRTAYRLV